MNYSTVAAKHLISVEGLSQWWARITILLVSITEHLAVFFPSLTNFTKVY